MVVQVADSVPAHGVDMVLSAEDAAMDNLPSRPTKTVVACDTIQLNNNVPTFGRDCFKNSIVRAFVWFLRSDDQYPLLLLRSGQVFK
mmetsp:Transcript_15909/g.18376  ORF Transcript_15909/g.18376 Transcript_15909/m.18376 type:complete len:87 (-) Transcript_15909:943-1203(-)